jgi:hypothetical protein
MGIRLINYVNNQLQTPALYTDAFAGRPAAGIYGRLFMSTDTKEIFQDLTTTWQLLADAGAGAGTLQSVCTNGSSTTTGITILSNNLALTNSASSFYIKALTVGSVLFCDDASGLVSQDNTNFFWDNTNNRLGLGTAAPSARLDVHSSSGTSAILNGTGVSNALLTFQSAGVNKWSVGNFVSSTVANDFNIYDTVNTVSRLQVHNTGVVNIPTTLIIGTTTATSAFAFDVTGTSRFTAQITGLSATFSSTLNAGVTTINANDSALVIQATTVNKSFLIEYKNSVATRRGYIGYGADSSSLFEVSNNENGGMAFRVNGSERWRIDTTGRLYSSNTTANNFALEVNGSATTGQSFGIITYAGTNGSDDALRVLNTSGTQYFKVRGDGNIFCSSVVYNSTSDGTPRTVFIGASSYLSGQASIRASKKNIKNVLNVDWLYQLNPITFNYRKRNEEGNYTEEAYEDLNYGLIAEDTAPIADFLINYDNREEGSKKMIGIEYSRLITPMLKAIQELNEKLVRNNIN